jgi:putative tryptophan/tyrosine transport system substrate-binding protein
MTKFSRIVLSVILLFPMLSLNSCFKESNTNQKLTYEVDVLLFGSNPLLLLVAKGIKEGANEKLKISGNDTKISINFKDHDAGFQAIESNQQTKQAIANKPSAIIALGTPSIKAALNYKDKGTPIYFGASSDPMALGFTKSKDPNEWSKPNALDQSQANVFGIVTNFQYDKMATLINTVSTKVNKDKKGKIISIGYPINESESNSVLALGQLKLKLPSEKFNFVKSPLSSPLETPTATRYLLEKDISLIQVGPDNTVAGGIGSIISITKGKKIPILASEQKSVEDGALAAYGVDFYRLGKSLGDKLASNILKSTPQNRPNIELFSEGNLYYNPNTLMEIFGEKTPESLNIDLKIPKDHIKEAIKSPN